MLVKREMLRKGGSNWVDRFFDREIELEALEERVRDGTHTLITAQRRMGKNRNGWRRAGNSRRSSDLEAAADPADAVAEIGVQAKAVRGAFDRIKASFANAKGSWRADHPLRTRIDAGNWPQKGDAIFTSLAESRRPVVLAIDELPILANRLLRGDTNRITPEGRRVAEAFLSWLRRNGQAHRGRISMILSGSIGLEPLLQQAGLSAHANIFSAYDLKPWSEETAVSCLAALAESYEIGFVSKCAGAYDAHPTPRSNVLRQAARSPAASGEANCCAMSRGFICTRCWASVGRLT